MATQVTVTQTKSVVDIDPPNEDYRYRLVSAVVVDTGSIEPEVFLLDAATNTFQHTCVLGDMFAYPNSPGTEDFYRQSSISLDFENLDDAVAEADLQLTRIQNLVTDWEAHLDNNWGDINNPTVTQTVISEA